MFTYLVHNKYLLIFWIGYLVSGVSAVGGAWGLYLARYCLGDESMMTVSSLLSMVPALAMGVLVPMICKKVDKFKFYCISIAASGILTLISRFVGYENIAAYLICSVLIAIPGGFTVMLGFMFTPDCAEYGVYKTGMSMPGITFAIQSFFVKLVAALFGSLGAVVLGLIGFVEGEGAVQAAGFAEKLWTASKLCPVAEVLLTLIIFHFYKLNDHDVQLMSRVNYGEMSREEAEAQMTRKY